MQNPCVDLFSHHFDTKCNSRAKNGHLVTDILGSSKMCGKVDEMLRDKKVFHTNDEACKKIMNQLSADHACEEFSRKAHGENNTL